MAHQLPIITILRCRTAITSSMLKPAPPLTLLSFCTLPLLHQLISQYYSSPLPNPSHHRPRPPQSPPDYLTCRLHLHLCEPHEDYQLLPRCPKHYELCGIRFSLRRPYVLATRPRRSEEHHRNYNSERNAYDEGFGQPFWEPIMAIWTNNTKTSRNAL